MLHVPVVHMRQQLQEMPNLSGIFATLGMDWFKELIECYSEFEKDLSNPETYPMAVFWNFYLEMVQALRDFVKSVKTGDRNLHMYASEKMFYWFHAYDNYNYSCHFSYYWASQQVLAKNHPSIFQHFRYGGFSIRRIAGKFNKVSPDQTIKQSINKDKKSRGNLEEFI